MTDKDEAARVNAARDVKKAAELLVTPVWREQQELLARIAYVRYATYLKAGFSESQALFLCCLPAAVTPP